jgi:oxygen-dependent protoporphyrinogen oxidase
LRDAVQLRSPVSALMRAGKSWNVVSHPGYARNATSRSHTAVILCAPAHRLAQIEIVGADGVSLTPLGQVEHPPVTSVVLGFRREDVSHPLDGFGMLVPEVERFNILGTLFSSTLFPNRAPEGHVTLTTYVGGTRAPATARQPEAALIDTVLRDLHELLGVQSGPVFKHHAVFTHAIPQYNVGYGLFKQVMNETELRAPGIYLGGHFRDGISLADSIVSGHRLAERVHHSLSRTVAAEAILHHV